MDFQALQALLNSANIALISPVSSSRTDEENHKAFILMEQLLKQAKIDFIPAKGVSKQWGEENSFVLKNIEEKQAAALALLFNQEAYIYKSPKIGWEMKTPAGMPLESFSHAQICNEAENMTVLNNGLAFTLV